MASAENRFVHQMHNFSNWLRGRRPNPRSSSRGILGEPELDITMVTESTAAYECVSPEALAHLTNYKYSSVDKSYISRYILKHYWNAFVELLPLWIAPNMVTLLGFLFIVGNVALMEFYVPDMVGPAPPWVYYSFAMGIWMYSTMDNVDGKQARRTGTSSGLGELFDHGIDSLNCTLASLLEVAAMGFGASRIGAFTAMIPCLPMFFSTWETFHTHTLYLGYFNGPTEGLLLAISALLLSGYYGPQIWAQPLSDFFSFPAAWQSFGTYSVQDLWVYIVGGAFLFAHLPGCVMNVAKARREKGLAVLPVFLEWVPILVYTAATTAWMSFVFGRMTTKIILAHLTRQPFPYWTVLIVPLVGGAVLTNLPCIGLPQLLTAQYELYYLWAYLVFAVVVYFRWAVLVISSICDFLGINCLTIPTKVVEKPTNSVKNANGKAH